MATFNSRTTQQRRPRRSVSRGNRSVSQMRNPKPSHLGAHPQRPASARAAAQSYPELHDLAVKLLPLVKSVAYQILDHLPPHVEVCDLAGAGVIGLLHAMRNFDARKHVKIETYARHRIRGAILDSLRNMDPVSRDVRRKSKNAEKIYERLQTALGRSVSDEEMARALGISLKKWYRLVRELTSVDIAWMRPNRIPEPNAMNEARLAADSRDNPFELCYRAEQLKILGRAAASLPKRERTVLALYYECDLTMKQTGKQIGVEESRVSQIHRAAITRLRDNVKGMLKPAHDTLTSSCSI